MYVILHNHFLGGLYDLRMGPYTDRTTGVCLTCHLRGEHCPGHLGHIELPLPVCHPLFYQVFTLYTYNIYCNRVLRI